ncbi:unnamed protein product [Rotaria sp. Silwood1]|nr:unnamed protein product [Rotaria sp. Silwood1]
MNTTNNKEDITLIWFDSNINSNTHLEQTIKQLRQINDYVVFHTQLQSCITFIQSIHNDRIIFISSIDDTSQILSHIATLPQIDSIFVFNWEKIDHQHLFLEHTKLIGIYDEFDLLYLSVQEQVDFLNRHLEIFSFFDQEEYLTRDLSKQTADLLWFQLYHDVLFELTYNKEAKQEMINASRSYYRDNIKELKVIEKFENEYQSEEALRWYSKKSFLYKIINEALRTKDFDQLYIFRYFMRDLTENLVREHQKMIQSGKEILFTYRGMKLKSDQIQKFKENEGKLILINGFFTTSILCSTALNQAMKSSKQTDLISVLLEIQCDLQQLGSSVYFCELTCEEQQEILFDSNVIFRLESVKMQENMWLIKMSVSNQGQMIKEKYIIDSDRQMKDLSIRILFGRLMCDMGQWNQAQHFFQHLLNNSNIYNEDIAKIEYNLGEVLQWKGEWSEARKYYDCAYERMMNVKPRRMKDSADILFNIGEILYQEGKYEEALDYYERTFAIRKESYSSIETDKSCPPNYQYSRFQSWVHGLFWSILLNLGSFFQSYSQWCWTRKFRELSRSLHSKYATNRTKPVDEHSSKTQLQEMCRNLGKTGSLRLSEIRLDGHVPIATNVRGFGKILVRQAKYDEALIFHQQALTMLEEYYQFPHINITVSLGYIAEILTEQKNYDKALDLCQRAMSICTEYYPNGHLYNASTLNYIGHIFYREGKYDDAFKMYEQALTMQQKYHPNGHVDIACSLNGIGHVYYGQGKYDEALSFYQQVLEILQKYYFNGHDNLICTLNNIGYMKKELQKYNEALGFHRQALAMQEKYYPSYYADIAHTLNYISNVLVCQSKYNEALCYCQRALTMQENYYPSGNASTASSLNNIGNILSEQGKYNEAIEFLQRALSTVEKHSPFDRYSIAFYMNNIGITLYKQEKYDEALDYHRRALEIQEKYCPSCQREIANTINYIGNVLIKQEKYDVA